MRPTPFRTILALAASMSRWLLSSAGPAFTLAITLIIDGAAWTTRSWTSLILKFHVRAASALTVLLVVDSWVTISNGTVGFMASRLIWVDLTSLVAGLILHRRFQTERFRVPGGFYGDITGRVGYAVDRTLIYAKGGAALLNAEFRAGASNTDTLWGGQPGLARLTKCKISSMVTWTPGVATLNETTERGTTG